MSPNPEVPEKPQRRRFTTEYKLQILEQADRTTEPGEVSALLRREGLNSSHLATWIVNTPRGKSNLRATS